MNRSQRTLHYLTVLILLSVHARSQTTAPRDAVSMTGMENLKLEKTGLPASEAPLPLDRFLSAPKIKNYYPHTVTFFDANGNVLKERRMPYRTDKGERLKLEEFYPMANGLGVFAAHWKSINDPSGEETPFEFTEAVDQQGNTVARIEGDYRLEAAPGFAYFVGIPRHPGQPTGVVAFFDKTGKRMNEQPVFFYSVESIAISEDGRYVLAVRGESTVGPSGMALFDGTGKLLWKKEEAGWQLAGPVGPFGLHEASLFVNPQGKFYVSSLRDGLLSLSLAGQTLWIYPNFAGALAADADWKRLVVLDPATESVALLDLQTGKAIASFKTPCEGRGWGKEGPIQLQGNRIRVKTIIRNQTGQVAGRCLAVLDNGGTVLWKMNVRLAIPSHDDTRPTDFDAGLIAGDRIVVKQGLERRVYQILKQ